MNTQYSQAEKDPRGANAEIEAQRREKRQKLVRRIILVLCILGGVGLGLLLRQARPRQNPEQRFNADGLEITLSSRFQETGDRYGFDRAYVHHHLGFGRHGFDRAYFSNHEQVFVSNEPLSGETLEGYAARRVTELAPGVTATALTEPELTGFEYRITEENKSWSCLCCFFEAEGRVWTLLFRCASKDYDGNRSEFLRFAKSAQVVSARPAAAGRRFFSGEGKYFTVSC